nr:MAG TPA: hypothetical protein [Caudoviricetes sp.]
MFRQYLFKVKGGYKKKRLKRQSQKKRIKNK